MKYRTLAAALLLGSVMFTSCVDEFSELNSDPSTITKPDIRFLFTKCEASFQPGDYAQWFGKCRLYATITNPLTVAKSHLLKDYDPEMNGALKYPLSKQLVFGVNVSF